jgi:hypothetical protein
MKDGQNNENSTVPVLSIQNLIPVVENKHRPPLPRKAKKQN